MVIPFLDALKKTLTNQNTELTNHNAAMMDQMTKLKTEITALDTHVQEANVSPCHSLLMLLLFCSHSLSIISSILVFPEIRNKRNPCWQCSEYIMGEASSDL